MTRRSKPALFQIGLLFFEGLLAAFFGLCLALLGLLLDSFGLLVFAGHRVEFCGDFAFTLGLMAFRQKPRLLANCFDAVRTIGLLVIEMARWRNFRPSSAAGYRRVVRPLRESGPRPLWHSSPVLRQLEFVERILGERRKPFLFLREGFLDLLQAWPRIACSCALSFCWEK